MKDHFLLETPGAVRLYEEHARALPIIDFHNHLSAADIASDRRYDNLYDLWLATDPYKHRLMRICGIPEDYITGSAAPREKFEKYCTIYPHLAGSPVYDWGRMELARVFGIEDLPTGANAGYLYDRTREMLHSPGFSTKGILKRFRIQFQSPVATALEDLSDFDGQALIPSLRADALLDPTADFLEQLKASTGLPVGDMPSYLKAVGVLLDRFSAAGCRFADHSLDSGFFELDTDRKQTALLAALGTEYAKRGWTLLLHLGAQRKTSTRLRALAGPAGGYAAAGSNFPIQPLCQLLDTMEAQGSLPDTVLFPLNPGDQVPLAVLQGSFAEDGTASKVQLGPAWWWNDHALGIRSTLDAIASYGVLSQFIGMTTDSRSILSFVRHDYFRRVLCSWLDKENARSGWDLPPAVLGEITRNICYENAKKKAKL